MAADPGGMPVRIPASGVAEMAGMLYFGSCHSQVHGCPRAIPSRKVTGLEYSFPCSMLLKISEQWKECHRERKLEYSQLLGIAFRIW
jgi:hypothetical protein